MCSPSYSEHYKEKIIKEFSLHGQNKERKRFRLFKVMNNLAMFCFNGCLPRYNVLLLITTCTKFNIYPPPPPKKMSRTKYLQSNYIKKIDMIIWRISFACYFIRKQSDKCQKTLKPTFQAFYGLEFFIHVYVYI